MARKTRPALDEFDIYECQTCEDRPKMGRGEVVAHLRAAHGVEGNPQGERQMVNHLDGAAWYGGTTKLTFAGIEIMHFYRLRRDIEGRAARR